MKYLIFMQLVQLLQLVLLEKTEQLVVLAVVQGSPFQERGVSVVRLVTAELEVEPDLEHNTPLLEAEAFRAALRGP